ncbi:GTP diphosphokinase [Candidatus Enterovibrio altilux]|uniref:GTP diphosphokinase n=1 Tax=Candidatus Enterovibrio altilux TaxID=1927128 RepID=UPI001237AC98|nr:GTP diphosphokinase [Candidatus Enterovibrio luxaltus]
MVAIRSAHLNSKEFILKSWVDSLAQETIVSETLINAYRHCQSLSNEDSLGQPLWCGREMIEILVTLSMDQETLLSALLFSVVEEGLLDNEALTEKYGNAIAKIVDGVQKMATIRYLNATTGAAAASTQINNVRRMLLSMVDDLRCVVIKLAERITHLRQVKNEPDEVRRTVAKECANIYVPLANCLGIGQLKWEIEDYAFRYQDSFTYKQIAKQLAERRIDREQYIDVFVTDLQQSMEALNINAQVYGRPKHIYSIWQKMQEKNLNFGELFDVRAVRIIANQLQDCYAALGVVHTKYCHLPKEFDDYVAHPKPNGYQSIHTVVLGLEGKIVEIQIRTKQMHENAELGVAAHWKYKEGATASHSCCDERIIWLRKLLEWQEEMSDSSTMLDELRSQVFDDRVYAFTPRGDVVNLPVGATPLDFAYHIHSEVGHRCIGAKVEGRIVPFTYHLQMGDTVEIITQKESNPSRDWLNFRLGFVNSGRARAKINAWFRKQSRVNDTITGKEMLGTELAKIGATSKDALLVVKRFNMNSLEEVYAGVGSGDLRINQVLHYINFLVNKPTKVKVKPYLFKKFNRTETSTTAQKIRRDAVVKGVDNIMTHLANCCKPISGDVITGYITRSRGISVHRADCDRLKELRHHVPERFIETVWRGNFNGTFQIRVRVLVTERNGLIKDLTNALTIEKVQIFGMQSRAHYKQEISIIDFDLELSYLGILSRVVGRLKRVQDVHEVKRLH